MGSRLISNSAAIAQPDQRVDDLIDDIVALLQRPARPADFNARIFEIYRRSEHTRFFEELHQIAMVVPEALAGLAAMARLSRGPILEIGPYVGASTLAILRGARDERPFYTIESGGQSDHASRGTDDILRDLRANLDAVGATKRVSILDCWASQAYGRLPKLLGDQKVGFLFVDADGAIDTHLNKIKPALAHDCLLAFDDWNSDKKATRVVRTITRLIELDALTPFGILDDSTWFGQLNGLKGLRALAATQALEYDEGFAWCALDVWPAGATDLEAGDRSCLELWEDGRPLGPAHSMHADIRGLGEGRFSHWGTNLFFSSSDNSDPRTNGRKYVAKLPDGEIPLN